MKLAQKLLFSLVIFAIIASMIPSYASANGNIAYGAATVDAHKLRIRTGPSLDDTVIDWLDKDVIIVVLERTTKDWYRINYNGTIGYVNSPYLREVLLAENFNAIGQVTGDYVNVRERPNTESNILAIHTSDTVMTVIGINNGWYKICHDGLTGYIRSDFMSIIKDSTTSSPSASSGNSKSTYTSPPVNSLGQQIVDYAMQYVGYKYVYGGSSPSTGFDCSGFTTYIFKHFDIKLTRNASGQYRDNGVKVSMADLMPGDLIFTSSDGNGVTHVGIYVGNNKYIHASGTGIGVVVSDSDSYTRTWYGAKRIV